jgi:hypothetical protein
VAGGQVIYRREFFDLQWQFATRVARLHKIPLADALLQFTTFYVRFGLGRQFDATDPVWREYLSGLRLSATPADRTYAFYLSRLPDRGAPGVVASVGCFSYARLAKGEIRLHFHPVESEGVSPLGAHRTAQRRQELGALFGEVLRREGEAVRVVGNSWLYNLAAYRRIFPEDYLATARPSRPVFRGMPLWGQFLDRRGSLRQAAAGVLLDRLSRLTTTSELAQCFPYQAIAVAAPAASFLD